MTVLSPIDAANLPTQRAPSRAWRKLKANKGALAGCIIIVFFALLAVFAPLLPIPDPNATDWSAIRKAPSMLYWFGTDDLGRDNLSRMIWGARASLLAGVISVAIAVAIGVPFGLVSGYFGGFVDSVLMRIADVALGIPFLPFVILMAGFLGARTSNVILGIALLLWPNTARVIRSQVLTVRERAFVEAARVTGASTWRILFVHVAPNILPLTFLYGSIAVGWAILTEASISFLGFGPSDTVSWGYMLQDAYASQALSRGDYNWFVPPGVCIVLVVVAGFFISRGYEEILFPKLKD